MPGARTLLIRLAKESSVPAVEPDDQGRRLPDWDVRLVPAAALGWLTAWVAPLVAAPVLVIWAAAALTLSCVLLFGTGRLPTHGRPFAAALGLALAGMALIAATAAAHVHDRDGSPLRQLAAHREDVLLSLEVSEVPHLLSPSGTGPRVLVAAVVAEVRESSPTGSRSIRSWLVDDPILVFAPAAGWADLSPGIAATASVSLAPAEGHDLLVAIAFARGPPERVAPAAGVLDAAAGDIRVGLRKNAESALDPDAAGLLRGIALGDTAGMDPVLAEDFRVSGLAHLTAVSGTNCAIVIGALLVPLRRSRLRAVSRSLIAGAALIGFVILVGPQPSVLRAAAMGAVMLIALATGRGRRALPALAATALALLAIDPGLARDLGFALSVAATAGIVVLAAPWSGALAARGWPHWLSVAVAVCAAAGLATAPLLVLISGRVSLLSLPANLLVIPVVAGVTVLGLLAALLSPLWAWPSEVSLRLADWPLRWMVWIAERVARTPGAVIPWPVGALGALLLAAAIVVLILALRHPQLRWLAAAACVGIVLGSLPVRGGASGWPPAGWSVVACDVGQGDAVVIAVGRHHAIVVDAGPDPLVVDACLRRLEVETIDLLLLSHLHADHVQGIQGVFRGRTVRAVGTSLDPPPSDTFAGIRETSADAGATMLTMRAGDRFVLGPATIDVLGPVTRYRDTRSDPNNSSVLARVSVGELSILLTGDMELEAQADLLRRRIDLSADVLKVAHHGSSYQEPAFLAATDARVALISVGADNDYGHPDPAVVNRLVREGATVYRTDQVGDIAVVDGAGSALTVLGRGDPIGAQASAARGRLGTVADGPRSTAALRVSARVPVRRRRAVAGCEHGERPEFRCHGGRGCRRRCARHVSGDGRGRILAGAGQQRHRGPRAPPRSRHRDPRTRLSGSRPRTSR